MKKLFSLLALMGLMLQSCSNNNDNPLPAPKENSIKIENNEKFGKILTDVNGMSLYLFSRDAKFTPQCNAGCLDIWPIFYEETLTLGTGLLAVDFATVTRTDGKKQTTYKGWPLHYYSKDLSAGETNGDKVNNIWFIAKPDYSLMHAVAQLKGHDDKNYKSDYTEGEGVTPYLISIDGRTLYTFSRDTKDTNTFTKPDFSNNGVWAIVEITLDKIPSIYDTSDFDTIDIYGKTQLTYKGWPLYYFGQDTLRGDNMGISFPSPGFWPVPNIDTIPAQ